MTDAVLTRTAVRKYQDQSLTDEQLEKLVEAFQATPAGMGQFDVMELKLVTSKALRTELEKLANGAFYGAPALFVVATKTDSSFADRDASCAAENLMIEAKELGLGSVYILGGAMALNKSEKAQELLHLKSGYNVSVVVPVGVSAEESANPDRTNRYQVEEL